MKFYFANTLLNPDFTLQTEIFVYLQNILTLPRQEVNDYISNIYLYR